MNRLRSLTVTFRWAFESCLSKAFKLNKGRETVDEVVLDTLLDVVFL